ncbi:MAG: hypothetical protein V4632_09760 [Pseudomonadota bacterium]
MQNLRHDPTDHESYDTSHLFDSVLDQLNLPDDAALSDLLGVAPSVISDIRHMQLPLEPAMLIRIHELTGISIIGLRNILGDRRRKLRFSNDPARTEE